jgi:hypothetical protein
VSSAPAGEIRLRLVPVTEVPQPRRGLRWWLFKAREAAERCAITCCARWCRGWPPGRCVSAHGWPGSPSPSAAQGAGSLEALEDEHVVGNEHGWDLCHARSDLLPGPSRYPSSRR